MQMDEKTTRTTAPRPGAGWFLCRRRNPEARVRLYCFPHAGGSTGEYVRLADRVTTDIEILAIQLPGRGVRFREPPLTEMADLAQQLANTVEFVPPFTFLGHSLGALMAFETARALRASGKKAPEKLLLSAAPPPHLVETGSRSHLLPDDEFQVAVSARYSEAADLLATRPELAKTVLTTLRADLQILETYCHVPADPLAIPFNVFGGSEDPLVSHLTEWEMYTNRDFTLDIFPGDHFYFRSQLQVFASRIEKSILPAPEVFDNDR